MTKKEWEELTLDEAIDWAYFEYGVYELTTEDTLISFAKEKIDEDNLFLAIHILEAIYNSEEAYNGYYLYDYSAGTTATPTPITCKEDLEDYISFEEDEEEEADPAEEKAGIEADLRKVFDFGDEEDYDDDDDLQSQPEYGQTHFW